MGDNSSSGMVTASFSVLCFFSVFSYTTCPLIAETCVHGVAHSLSRLPFPRPQLDFPVYDPFLPLRSSSTFFSLGLSA